MDPNSWAWLLGVPVLLPFAGAALCLLFARYVKVQRAIALTIMGTVLFVTLLIVRLARRGPVTLDVGAWSAPVGITLVADRLSALMLLISVFITLGVLVFSLPQRLSEGTPRLPLAIFNPTYLILSAGVSNAFLTGDLFNLYVGFEILLVASFVLITLGGTRERIRSGAIYVIVSLVSSTIFLIGLAMVYAAAGTVNMAQLALRLPEIDHGVSMLIQIMLIVAFGIKAAIFPLSAWLPDSYPTAPAPVTAVFAGLLTKVGVYAMIRVQTIIFGDASLNPVILVIAVLTMVVGIVGAVAQDDLKRLLSFTLVSHIGFMMWGIGTGTVDGMAAAIFYTSHHIIVQTALFLVSGLVEHVGGTTSLTELGSLLKRAPLVAVLFMVPALNLAGIPPMSGFIGKIGLIEASASVGRPLDWVVVAGGILSSLLTLYALIRAWNMAFWQPAEEELPKSKPIPLPMTLSTAALVIGSLLLTVFGQQFYAYSRNAAVELYARAPYIFSVLPDAERGTGESHDEGGDVDPTNDPELEPTLTAPISAPPGATPSPTTSVTATPTAAPRVKPQEQTTPQARDTGGEP